MSTIAPKNATTTYKEKQIGNTLYRITCVFTGEKDLGKTLEKLAIDKVIGEIRTQTQAVIDR